MTRDPLSVLRGAVSLVDSSSLEVREWEPSPTKEIAERCLAAAARTISAGMAEIDDLRRVVKLDLPCPSCSQIAITLRPRFREAGDTVESLFVHCAQCATGGWMEIGDAFDEGP